MAETLEQKANRLRREAMKCDELAREQKNADARKREKELEAAGFPRPYWADDYAGVGGPIGFYYGYESTQCPVHGDDPGCEDEHDCAEAEWCFVAMSDDGEVCRIPRSQLNVEGRVGMMEYVLAGIGAMVAKGLLVLAEPAEPTGGEEK